MNSCQDRCNCIHGFDRVRSRPRDHAAGHRDRHACRGGIAQRQALQAARRQEAERLRLDGVGGPAQRVGGLARSPAQGARAASASSSDCGRRRRRRSSSSAPSAAAARSRAIAAAVNAVSVAAPSAGDMSSTFSAAKSLRSSDFGGGSGKNGCCQRALIQARRPCPCAAVRPSRSIAGSCAAACNRRAARCPGRYRRRSAYRPSI